jgi:ATP-dependent protease HslVU (ClpYQ) ATPase subunit
MNILQNTKQQMGRLGLVSAVIAGLLGATIPAASALAATKTTSSADQTRIAAIISRGDAEITRRLATLNTLTTTINGASHLTASDKTTLSGEVSSTISGLTSLKTQLDAEMTISGARTDAQNILSEYRVYALVAPKVRLIKVADDQQVVETKLTALATKLQARITTDQQAGKNVTALQSDLTDMTTKTQAAQQLSSSIESKIIGLEPSDYNSDHTILSGDGAQLKTAHADNQAAYQDAKNITAGLKTLG